MSESTNKSMSNSSSNSRSNSRSNTHYSPGLEGVVVGETSISHVEGDIGRLSYRGEAIEEIVKRDYLEVAYLVLFGSTPSSTELTNFAEYLAAHGQLTSSDRKILEALPGSCHAMMLLAAMIPVLTTSRETYADLDEQNSRGLQIVARLPALLAGIRKCKEPGFEPASFDRDLDYCTNFLHMFNGRMPDAGALSVFRTVQLLQMEHSFNAGTFASMVIGSTEANVEAVIAGGVGALSGILHGGADEAALKAALEVGSPANAADYVDKLLARKGKLMGMGHREYKTVDPRSVIIKPMAERLCRNTPHEIVFQTLVALEVAFNTRMREKGKDVWANLEFYKGVIYEALGISPDYFTATFAMARSVGWLAHFRECRENNRIIRPAALYTGPAVRSAS